MRRSLRESEKGRKKSGLSPSIGCHSNETDFRRGSHEGAENTRGETDAHLCKEGGWTPVGGVGGRVLKEARVDTQTHRRVGGLSQESRRQPVASDTKKRRYCRVDVLLDWSVQPQDRVRGA